MTHLLIMLYFPRSFIKFALIVLKIITKKGFVTDGTTDAGMHTQTDG